MRTSVIIPCIAKHQHHLPDLVRRLENQTVRPDEIVIAISNTTDDTMPLLRSIASPIPIALCVSAKECFAGENRQRGSEFAIHELLIYQDADDLPHPQRIEITKYFFQNYSVLHLNGLWQKTTRFYQYNIPRIPFVDTNEILSHRYEHGRPYCHWTHAPIHCGNVAIHADVTHMLPWGDDRKGQDHKFCLDVLYGLKQSMILLAPLVCYRLALSSWNTK
jgi:glycosyltransferase involved in cell wall biosynthesis